MFTALFRLALNVSSTSDPARRRRRRRIRTFGGFVVGGQPLVGIVIFLVLVVIQFIVIIKGQNRIARCRRASARRDAGKQMSIDADLSA